MKKGPGLTHATAEAPTKAIMSSNNRFYCRRRPELIEPSDRYSMARNYAKATAFFDPSSPAFLGQPALDS